jgi:alpha-tubulin suppressor-like RCC1 family protein
VDVSGLGSGVVAVSAGGFHTCALTDTGAVKCWGHNNRGQLGDGTGTDRTTPVDVLGFPDGAAVVSAGGGELLGGGHTCGVTALGGAVCWGRNEYGQLGDGTTADSVSPVAVVGLTAGVADVHGGRWHSCALTISGGAKCWGWNGGGTVGDGSNTTRTTPVDVVGLNNGVEALSTGGVHSCAVTVSGGVKCWGMNTTGQVGDGTSNNHRTAPVDVLEAPGGQPLTGVAAVAAGGSITNLGHTCVVTDSGGVKCWGDNEFGQLGDGTTTDRTTPVDVVGFTPKVLVTPTATSSPTATDVPLPTQTPPSATIEELIDDLDEAVDTLDVPRGVGNSLGAKLDAALQRVLRDRPCAAANSVGAFINEVEALERSRRISSDEASDLIAQAERIAEQLLADGGCDS